jgi:hypothetical protein
MESVVKIVAAGGLAFQVSLWAAVVFFIVGGTLGLLRKALNLRNAWRMRPPLRRYARPRPFGPRRREGVGMAGFLFRLETTEGEPANRRFWRAQSRTGGPETRSRWDGAGRCEWLTSETTTPTNRLSWWWRTLTRSVCSASASALSCCACGQGQDASPRSPRASARLLSPPEASLGRLFVRRGSRCVVRYRAGSTQDGR